MAFSIKIFNFVALTILYFQSKHISIMTNNLSHLRSLLLAGSMMLAFMAGANNYFYIDFPVINEGGDLFTAIVPVKAKFDAPVSSWNVQFTFPEGITPLSCSNGSDMTLEYIDWRGDEQDMNFTLMKSDDFTSFASTTYGWLKRYDEDEDDYSPSNRLLWEAGTYEEMFLIECRIEPYAYNGGDIEVYTQTSCSPYSVGTPIEGDYEYIYSPADINGDCTINVTDVTSLMEILVNGYGPGYGYDYGYILGDINHNGQVDISDVESLISYLVTDYDEGIRAYDLNESTTISPIHFSTPAYISFYTDDYCISMSEAGSDFTIPVKADFMGNISAWDLQIDLPYGLSIVSVTPGSDMTLHYTDYRGNERTERASYAISQDKTHIVARTGYTGGYEYNEETESYEPYGSIKWESGSYNEMLLLTLRPSDGYSGGELFITAKATCGIDKRYNSIYFWPDTTLSYHEEGFLPGDINHDGIINVADLTHLMECIVGNESIWPQSDDVHQDGVVDIMDLEKIIDFLVLYDDNNGWMEGYLLSESIDVSMICVDTPPVPDIGDLNGDGSINVTDVTLLISMLINNEEIDPAFGDVNGDGLVNVTDVTYIINIVIQSR